MGHRARRKGQAKEKARVHGVNLYPSEWEALRRLAFENHTTVSEQVRRAVTEYLNRREKGKER